MLPLHKQSSAETASLAVLGRVFSVTQISMTGVMLISILFFGPLANIVRVEHILLASSAMLASVGAIFGLSERVNPQA